MSPEGRYYRVGIFVFAGLALIVGAVLFLGGQTLFDDPVVIETYFDESVQGLEVGSPVKLRGVRLGEVRWIGFADDAYADQLPTFEVLSATTTHEFYEEDPGTNYAQARYLLYYLQEKGLLRKYYRQFLAAQKSDPTGFETLKAVLDEDDMEAFQKRWEQYVLRLRFR